MAVLAIPFAASGRTGGALAGVAVAIGIAVVYWVTAGLFEAMGNANQLPAMLAAWAPDFIFALAGGYFLLCRRSQRSGRINLVVAHLTSSATDI